MSASKGRRRRLTLRIPEDLLRRLEQIKDPGLSVNDYICNIVEASARGSRPRSDGDDEVVLRIVVDLTEREAIGFIEEIQAERDGRLEALRHEVASEGK